MNKMNQNIITIAFALAAAILASAVMIKFTPNDSWLEFAGWVIFYISIQMPFFLYTQKSQESCTAWLSRLMRRETR